MVKKVNAEKTAETNTKRTLRVLIGCAIFSIMFITSTSNVFADKDPTTSGHYVSVSYTECATGGTARTEQWHENSNPASKVIYQEYTNCVGETEITGKKPVRDGGPGEVTWKKAEDNARLYSTSLASELANDYPPIDSGIVVDSDGDISVEWYDFDFPIDWIYKVANTFISQKNNTVTITSDDFVQAQIVNLSTGEALTELCNVNPNAEGYTFYISDLPYGCRYSIVVSQYVPEAEDILIIRGHNFCRE